MRIVRKTSAMSIPFADLSQGNTQVAGVAFAKIRALVKQGNFISGSEVQSFETAFASYLGVRHCIGVGNGTDALALGFQAAGIGDGDEVIVPAMTFIATLAPLVALGAVPVLVDISPDRPLLDPSETERAITEKTRAIVAVHLHGYMCDMDSLRAIAKKHHLLLIEDAAQAHGSTWHGVKAGAAGIFSAFSFYPAKNLGCWGDGGAVVTNDDTLARKIRLAGNHGQQRKNWHVTLGGTSRLDTLQAIVLSEKLVLLESANEKRRTAAALYARYLTGLPLNMPTVSRLCVPNFHVFAVETPKRDSLRSYLEANGVSCGIHYPHVLHHQPALAFLGYPKDAFPNAVRFAAQTLSLPMFPGITDEEVRYVARLIHRFFGGNFPD